MNAGQERADQKLVRGRWLVAEPAQLPGSGLIENGALVVEGDTIVAVGGYEEMHRLAPDAEEIGSDRHVVLPGLVNTHHHGRGLTALQLGVTDDYLEPWLIDWRMQKPLDAYLDTLYGTIKLIRSGVTTVLHAGVARNVNRFEADTHAALRAYEDSGLRVAYAVQALDQHLFVYQDDEVFLASLPAELSSRVRDVVSELTMPTTHDFFALVRGLQERYASHPRISIMLCPVGPDWCSDDLLSRVREAANEYDTGIHLHCLESPYQRVFGRSRYGKTTVEHLRDLGLLGPRISLGHAVWLTEQDMELCAASGTSVCHCASSNLRLRVGLSPAARMLEKGVNLSIGMDGITLNDDDDMIQELRLVAKLHRLPSGLEHLSCPSSFDVLRMATTNASRPTGLDGRIGALMPGRLADVVLIDYAEVTKPYISPDTHVVDALLYRARATDVDWVLVGGEVVLADKRLVKLDEAEILRELAAIAEEAPPAELERWVGLLAEVRPYVEGFFERWESPEYAPSYSTNSLR